MSDTNILFSIAITALGFFLIRFVKKMDDMIELYWRIDKKLALVQKAVCQLEESVSAIPDITNRLSRAEIKIERIHQN